MSAVCLLYSTCCSSCRYERVCYTVHVVVVVDMSVSVIQYML